MRTEYWGCEWCSYLSLSTMFFLISGWEFPWACVVSEERSLSPTDMLLCRQEINQLTKISNNTTCNSFTDTSIYLPKRPAKCTTTWVYVETTLRETFGSKAKYCEPRAFCVTVEMSAFSWSRVYLEEWVGAPILYANWPLVTWVNPLRLNRVLVH